MTTLRNVSVSGPSRHCGAWIGLLIPLVLIVGLLSSARAQTVQLQLNSAVMVTNTSAVSSCSTFSVDMSYGVVSPTTAAFGAVISLPLRGLGYAGILSNPDVSTVVVRGTSPNDTLRVVLVSPLTAGRAGNVSVSLRFPCGTTCSGTTASVQPSFNATNATGEVSSSPVSLTAQSVDPLYQVGVVQNSYNGSTRRGTYTVRVSPFIANVTNFLALTSPVMSLTVPANVNIITAGTSGSRNSIPNNLPSGSFTPTSTTAAGPGGTRVITWTNLPTFFRGGTFDISNVVLEYPVAQFPAGTSTTLVSGMSGTLSSSALSCGTAFDTTPFSLTVTNFTPTPGATGCSGQVLLSGLSNPWNAIFEGKANQARIAVPVTNTGNVPLSNITYAIDIPTNELNATQVGISGSTGTSGAITFQTNLNSSYRALGASTSTGTTRSFTLTSGEFVTRVRVVSTSLAVGSNMSVQVTASQLSPLRSGSAVNPVSLTAFMAVSTSTRTSCFGGFSCATTSATVTAEYEGDTILNQSCTGSRVVVQPQSGIQNFQKTLPTTAPSYVPGQVYQYRIRFQPVTVGDTLRNFVITDVLPATLEYAGNLKYSHSATPPTGPGTFTTGTSLPQFTQAGQTLTWSWAALPAPRNRIVSTSDHYLFFDVRIRAGAPVGTIQNCATVTGTSMFTVAGVCQSITVSSLSKIDAIKWVRGDLDRNYTRFPKIGHTTDGGKSDYRFVLVNTGNVAYKNMVLIDIFPWIGDQIVAADYARETEWRPRLSQSVRFYAKAAADSSRTTVNTITTPAGVTVAYSTQNNPCRTEFTPAYSPAGCVPNSWSTAPPADLSTVQAIKLNIAGPFAAGDTLVFGVDMRSPVGTALDLIAWNSFAYQVTRNDNNLILPVAEPNKVGIDVKRFPALGNYVWQDLNGNGRQDELPGAGTNGVSVQLWSPGGDDLRGTADDFLVGTRLTANDPQGQPGYYRFDSLFAETYYLRFIAPVGQRFTRSVAPSVPDSLNSKPDGFTGWTDLTTLQPNEQEFVWDAGLCTVPDAGPDRLLCSPVSSVKLPNATGAQSWTALDSNPAGATIDPLTGQIAGLGSGTYGFLLTAGGGCVDTVFVDRRPPAAAGASSLTVCSGDGITLAAQPVGTLATYQWSGPNGYAASGQTVTIATATAARTGSYTLTMNESGCESATTVAVTVNAVPQLTVLAGACVSSTNRYTLSGTLTVSNPGQTTLILTDTDGVRSSTALVVATQATVGYSFTGLLSGTGSHTLTAAYAQAACTAALLTYAAPVSCSCVVSATLTAGACQPNGTYPNATDDYFRPQVRAANTVPGGSGRFEVVLGASADGSGGTVLNGSGTAYGQAVLVGAMGQFPADNATMFRLTIRDADQPACYTTRLTPSVAPCSACPPPLCKVPELTRVSLR